MLQISIILTFTMIVTVISDQIIREHRVYQVRCVSMCQKSDILGATGQRSVLLYLKGHTNEG